MSAKLWRIIDNNNDVITKQNKEIEELKTKLAKMEELLLNKHLELNHNKFLVRSHEQELLELKTK